MRSFLIALAAGVAGLAHAAAPLQVDGAWSRPAAAGGTGAGFMTLKNPGKVDDALVAAESPLARKVEIHRTTMAAGVASMQKLESVPAPAGATVTFAPGGYHLMFLGLARPLKPGDTLPATLTFASGARTTVNFAVRVAAPAADHPRHQH